MSNHRIIDYETLVDCTVLCACHYKTDEMKTFAVCRLLDQFREMHSFLLEGSRNGEWHISFNGISFDSQITEFILHEGKRLYDRNPDPVYIAGKIYEQAQSAIEKSNNKEWAKYAPWSLSHRQIDLYKMNYWDSRVRSTSLKWAEYSMDWPTVQEMPIHHTTSVRTQEQLDKVIWYCKNDVLATKRIMDSSRELILLRKGLTERYNLDLYSSSEPKISKDIFLLFLSKRMGVPVSELKTRRTFRDDIVVKNLILPSIEFKTEEFKAIKYKFESLVLDSRELKGKFKHTLNHKRVKTDFKLGGIHGAAEPGVYEARDGMIIMTSDVKSFYPNLIITNKWAPGHLPADIFCELYRWFYQERLKLPKKDPGNYAFKIVLNSTYGLSNEVNSPFYDPQLTMLVTMNGQLALAMLYEMISTGIPGSIPLMQNTDGLETMIPEQYEQRYLDICARWEKIMSLELEHDQYQRMIIADVNSYIAVEKLKEISAEAYEKGKTENYHHIFKEENGRFYTAGTKAKGRLGWKELEDKKAGVLHRNKSFLIIPMAIYNYFVHGIPPEKTILENRNIYHYCAGAKTDKNWDFVMRKVVEGKRKDEPLQKVVRYYISESGGKIIKVNKEDKREINEVAGKWLIREFNVFEEKDWKDYQINETYYLEEIYKEIGNIKKAQLSLFP